jgi:hypothetical protein
MMKRLLLTAILLIASTAWATPIDDVATAIVRGDYAAALRIKRLNARLIGLFRLPPFPRRDGIGFAP